MRNQSDFSHLTSQQIQETEDHFLQVTKTKNTFLIVRTGN